ncbi:MAG TPA: anhydro-N-acetylmuramic acid kinase [Arachnia sp.]|nr:anhydro-N-acetylmuramic acid kinase [Arachnia sp.]
MAVVIGINSGSSFDGVDAVAIEIDIAEDGHPTKPRFIAGASYDWPAEVAVRVLAAFENEVSLFEMTRLNYEAGAVYADAATALMRDLNLTGEDVAVIGFDGQTIYQEPPVHARLDEGRAIGRVARWHEGIFGAGMQIGEPSVVAVEADTYVVTQFRPADHALGGTGAPLMQYLDFVAFRDIGPVLTLNIGGIANCQLADADRSKMMAFDTGPGNVMIDHAMSRLEGKSYDADGALARTGTVIEPLLEELKNHPYFARPVPRSAWRLDFGSKYADAKIDEYSEHSSADLVATFTQFSAIAISRSIQDHVPNLDQMQALIASGGGVRNGYLMERLAAHLPASLRLTTSDEFGIPAPFKEAIKFGTLAFANLNDLANNIPAASGASKFTVLGKRVTPPRAAKGI